MPSFLCILNCQVGKTTFQDGLQFRIFIDINTALRISDLLQLRIGQFLDERGRYKRRFWIYEQKRNKRHEVNIKRGQAWKFIVSICREVGLS